MPFETEFFEKRLTKAPLDYNGVGSQTLERLLKRWRNVPELSRVTETIENSQPLTRLLCGVFAGSPFLSSIIERYPENLRDMLTTSPETRFCEVMAAIERKAAGSESIRTLMADLRQARTHVALLTALADLGGVWSVDNVVLHLSKAADAFTATSIRFLLTRAHKAGTYLPVDPDHPERESGLIVLGMGKLGGCELNYSSDIDLIVFFDRKTTPLAKGIEPQPFFVRLTRDLVHMLQERTADGYVYRVDLRLRPDPASTQAAISTEAAFSYYETLGQNWERAAFIKARPIAGDLAAGEAFLKELSPYIWRKYLDYHAISDIHAMKRQIHAAKGHAEIAVLGHNLKLGRGGIREIEFFVQSQQLIAGGRHPMLRTRRTTEALDRLAELEWITPEDATELSGAYRHLRSLEHRLQMVRDEQTHTLPCSPVDLVKFAQFSGYEQVELFEHDLRATMSTVQTHYAALFEDHTALTHGSTEGNLVFTGDDNDPSTVETLARLGFRNPSAAIATIKGWHFGRYRAMRSVRARELLTEFTPSLLDALAETADPDLALVTLDAFLAALPAAVQLFSLLHANPEMLSLLARIMGSAPRLARILSRRPRLLDAVLDPGFLSTTLSRDDMRDYLDREIREAGAYEQRLDRARILAQEQSFYIGAGLLSGQLSPNQAGHCYSLLAEALIASLLQAVQDEFGNDFPPPAVLGLGKLGGGEMTATSDLDLIVVYDEGASASAPQHYARLTQRLIAALSAQTAQGQIYSVDLRLRPSGKAGPVAVNLTAFTSYQRHEAWTWEHMALSRARVVAGPLALREKLAAYIQNILCLERDATKVARDVKDMRALIAKEKGAGGVWDVKNQRGGLLDIEFIVQLLQIAYAASHPQILHQNTQTALQNLETAGLLNATDAKILQGACKLYNNITQILRLCTEAPFELATAPRDLIEFLLHVTEFTQIDLLQEHLTNTYDKVFSLFEDILSEKYLTTP